MSLFNRTPKVETYKVWVKCGNCMFGDPYLDKEEIIGDGIVTIPKGQPFDPKKTLCPKCGMMKLTLRTE